MAHVLHTPLPDVAEMAPDEVLRWHAEAISILKAINGGKENR